MVAPIYDVDADRNFRKTIEQAQRTGLDLSFSMGEAARIIKKESTKNFILKGSGKYPPLSPAYRKHKQLFFPGAPILVRTGRLRDSIIGNTSDTILRLGKRSLEYGTKARDKGRFYPRMVQEGIGMPARAFLFFSKRMVKQIMNTVKADIENQL